MSIESSIHRYECDGININAKRTENAKIEEKSMITIIPGKEKVVQQDRAKYIEIGLGSSKSNHIGKKGKKKKNLDRVPNMAETASDPLNARESQK